MRIEALQIDVRKAHDAGIGTYVREVVPRVARQLGGLPIELLIPRGGRARHGYAEGPGIRFVELEAAPLSLSEQLALRRVGRGRLLWATSLAHPLFGTGPLFATVHDMAQVYGGTAVASRPVSAATRLYFRSLLRSARGLACVSAFTFGQVQRFLGHAPTVPAGVTPLGVSPEWRVLSAAPRPGDPYFLFIGSVRRHKNVATLLRAFERVAGELPHRLVVAGNTARMDPEVTGLLEALARAHPGRVALLGLVPQAELVELTARAEALVFPSLYEGFGLPPLEAMAAGCPVIASAVTSIPEVCGEAALYFDPASPEQLAERLRELGRDEGPLRRLLVEAGLARSRAFTWERCAGLTAELLRLSLRDLDAGV